MTLEIGIRNPNGIVFGADSLVSLVQTYHNRGFLRELDSLCEKNEKKGSLNKEDFEELQSIIYGYPPDEITTNTFLAKKLYPIYPVDGKCYGALVAAGAPPGNLFEELRHFIPGDKKKGNPFKDMSKIPSFDQYIKELKKYMLKKVDKGDGFSLMIGGYCKETDHFQMLKGYVDYDEDKKKKIITLDDLAKDEKYAFHALGNTDVVDKLILGIGDDGCRRVEKLLIEKINEALLEFVKRSKIQIDKKTAKKIKDSGLEDWLTEQAEYWAYDARDLESDFSPFEDMSLQECIRIIHFLISTTASYQEMLEDGIPSVGGTIYLGSITRDDGFQYRTLGEIF
jgi:hypothetical protein